MPGSRRKTILAVLGLCSGQTVSYDLLIKLVWGDRTPHAAINALQSHISYLRRVLGSPAAIRARPSGYRLDLGTEGTDVLQAEGLISRARTADSAQASARHLRAALSLWRGRPLADLQGELWFTEHSERLERLRLKAVTALVEARLALGDHLELIGELKELAGQNHFDEDLHGQLMLALYRSGRQADALAVYHEVRDRLAGELGLDPSPRLRDLEQAILRHDPFIDNRSPTGTMTAWSVGIETVPVQLPSSAVQVVGRNPELVRLDHLLSRTQLATAQPSGAVFVISGMPGVGKTSLAVRWAHLVSNQFPDGQLYLDLQGFSHDRPPLKLSRALDAFLIALGVPAGRLPPNEPSQIAMFRNLLAGKRILVLLDNASDAAQVRPLLPSSPGSLAVVISRDLLTPLRITENAEPNSLEPLGSAASHDLLATRVDPQRLVEEAAAAKELIAQCAGLPLALAIAATQLTGRPTISLTTLVRRMRSSASILDVLNSGDPATDLRTVFASSYRALSAPAANLFRRIGLQDDSVVTTQSCATLADLPEDVIRPALAELTSQHLLTPLGDEQYRCHELLISYAKELPPTSARPRLA